MENVNKENETQIESQEDIDAETSHLVEIKEDEVRKEIISEFGFDETEDEEKIEKAVQREIKHRKNLSSAIGQKRKYREAFNTNKSSGDGKAKPDIKDEDIDDKVSKALEKRDLDEMEYPDDLKKAIQSVSKINGCTIKQATKDPYIVAKIESWQKQQDAEDASLGKDKKREGKEAESNDPTAPPDVDLNTEEGRAKYDKWKADAIKKGY